MEESENPMSKTDTFSSFFTRAYNAMFFYGLDSSFKNSRKKSRGNQILSVKRGTLFDSPIEKRSIEFLNKRKETRKVVHDDIGREVAATSSSFNIDAEADQLQKKLTKIAVLEKRIQNLKSELTAINIELDNFYILSSKDNNLAKQRSFAEKILELSLTREELAQNIENCEVEFVTLRSQL